MLWPVSKRPDSGRLVCSGRLGGVQSLDTLDGLCVPKVNASLKVKIGSSPGWPTKLKATDF